jgi:putative spermidine/putrescine transport system permease protein
VFAAFLVFPIALIVVVSFWDYTEYAIVPDFILRNYAEVFGSAVTYKTF